MTPRAAIMAAAGVVMLAASASTAAAPTTWDFDVTLDGKPIGYHRFTLTGDGAEREMKIEARFAVKVLIVTAYRYAHDASERWRGNCVESLVSRTDDDGEKLAVEAQRSGEALAVTAARGRNLIDGCVMTFAYWNPDILRRSRLLNGQTGEYEAVKITALLDGTETVRGKAVTAKHYRITGPANPIDLWYAPDGTWVALESTVAGGRRLRYQLK